MCYLVLVGVPEQSRAAVVEELTRSGFSTSMCSIPALTAAFPRGDVVIAVTYGGCSCDIFGEPFEPFDESAQREKYQRKGWSQAKIARAITATRPQERPRFAAFRASLARMVRLLGAVRLFACAAPERAESPERSPGNGGILRLDEYLAQGGAYRRDLIYDVRAG